MFRHLNELGGSLAHTVKKVVGLKGMDTLELVIHSDSVLFVMYSDLKLSSWKNLKKLFSPSDFIVLTQTSIGKSNIRNIITLPFFLVNTIKTLDTIQAEAILVQMLT